jgi:hypothetical protein
MRAIPLLVLAVASGCAPSGGVKQPANCSVPLPGFHSFHISNFTQLWPVPIDGYQTNVVKVTNSGAITWNGIDIATMEDGGESKLDTYLEALKSFQPQPFTALDFDAGAPCGKVNAVRQLMIQHLRCSKDDLCFQGRP